MAGTAAAGFMARRSRCDAVCGELPADTEPIRGPGSLLRGLPVPERRNNDVAHERGTTSARVDPRRWLHADASRNYDGTELAAHGVVVVTINYRLGALGFLAHPALAFVTRRPFGQLRSDGPAGRARSGCNGTSTASAATPATSPIAGQSAGGVSVLAHMVSQGSRGLFERRDYPERCVCTEPSAARESRSLR